MSDDRHHKTRLGDRELHPETLMLGYGYDPTLSEGAVKPPIFLTSTFVFSSAEHGKEFFDYVSGRKQPAGGLVVGPRLLTVHHPNAEIVEERLAIYEARRRVCCSPPACRRSRPPSSPSPSPATSSCTRSRSTAAPRR